MKPIPPLRVPLLLALLTLVLLTGAPPAGAHARLAHSSIAPGAILPDAPRSIALSFTEAIDPTFSSGALVSSSQEVVSGVTVLTDPGDDRVATFVIEDAANLPPGSYALVWRVVSGVDGHATSGLLAFSAGTGTSPDIASSTATAAGGWPATIGRWLEFGGLMAIAGAAAFAVIAGDPTRSLRSILPVAIPAALIGALLTGGSLVATATGERWGAWPGREALREIVSDTSPGRALAARLALLVALALLTIFTRRRTGRWTTGAWAITTAGALATFSFSGHAAGLHGSTAIAIDLAHLLGGALWSGGLLLLALSLRTLPVSPGPPDTGTALRLIRRFSRLALIVFAVIVATGLVSAAFNVSGPRNLTGESYGRFLLLKTIFVLLIVTVAAVNRFLIVPRLIAAERAGDETAATSNLFSLRRTTLVELALAIAVLVIAARITALPPADGPLTVDVASRSGPILLSESAGDLTIAIVGDLRNLPGDQIEIAISDALSGVPATGLARVIVLATAPNPFDPAGPPLRDRFDADPVPDAPGRYTFPRSRLGVETTWNLEISARRLGVEDEVASFALDLRATAPQPPRLVEETWRRPRVPWSGWLSIAAAAATAAGGLMLVRRLRGLEPVTAGIMLAVTALIVVGFLLSAYRAGPLPITGPAVDVPGDLGDDAVIQRAAGLWSQQCASCHGIDAGGTGEPPEDGAHTHPSVAGDLLGPTVRDRTPEELFWAITAGIGGTQMPAFDLALTDRERWDLVAYLRWLQEQSERD